MLHDEIEISSDPKMWFQSLTAHYLVPMSCQDIFLLQSFEQVFKEYRCSMHISEAKPLFFGPHPIFRVSVAARVAKKDPKNAIVVLHLDDGSSSRNLTSPCAVAQLHDSDYIQEDSFVVIEGQVKDHNLYGRQIIPDRIASYRRNRINVELAYQYEALEVRRKLLERKVIWPVTSMMIGGQSNLYNILREKFGLPAIDELKGIADVVIRCI